MSSTPFRTHPVQVESLHQIVLAMYAANVDKDLVRSAYWLAVDDQGVFDLMLCWLMAEGEEDERSACLQDLRRSVDDHLTPKLLHTPTKL